MSTSYAFIAALCKFIHHIMSKLSADTCYKNFHNSIPLCSLAVAVHFFIVVLIFTGDDSFPPFLVVQIPLDGLLDTVCEFCFRQPAEFVVDLGRIDRIAHIMAFTVCYIGDQAFRFAKFLADDLNDIDVLSSRCVRRRCKLRLHVLYG